MAELALNRNRPTRVVLVDDHAMVRQGIRYRLDQEDDIVVVGEAETREAGIALVEQLQPDVVVLDIRLRQDSGIEVAKKLRAEHPNVKILILSAYDFDQYVRALARVGVDGYISKENSQDELVEAIRKVINGGSILSPRVATKVMRNVGDQAEAHPAHVEAPQTDDLKLREIEILQLMSENMSSQEIADHLALQRGIVEAQVSMIMAKLGATSRSEAVKIAKDAGLI